MPAARRPRLRTFVVAAPGLECFVVDEVRELGVTGARVVHGGVEAELSTRQLYALHRRARVATRVLVRVAEAKVTRFDALQQLVRSVPWNVYIAERAPVTLHVACQMSRLHHEGAVAERVTEVIGHPVLSSADATDDVQAVHVRIDHDRVTLSVDASGALFHQRGWRTESHRSPLRTTIAAAMLRAATWDPATPLVDPMAGSGTIPIEAATWATGAAHQREFAFQRWPSFEPGTWASVRADEQPDRLTAPVIAADRDAGAIDSIRKHAAAAGIADRLAVEHAPLSSQQWPDTPSLVITNPPYGRRVGGGDLRDLYASLGRRAVDGGHRLVLLAADDRLTSALGTHVEELFATTNGGIRIRCMATG
jgi:putative N6-adenine-specific DNA methylase